MTSGQWITLYMLGGLAFLVITFIAWEFIQLYRRRKGNKSAKTLTQWVTSKADGGSEFWHWFTVVFPIVLVLIGVWLIFHFEGLCREWEFVCELSKNI